MPHEENRQPCKENKQHSKENKQPFKENKEILKGTLLYTFLYNFGSKWSGKVPNVPIMDGNYSQTPCGDFWTDSGRFVLEITNKFMETSRRRKTDFSGKSNFAIRSMRKSRLGRPKRRTFDSQIGKKMIWKQA